MSNIPTSNNLNDIVKSTKTKGSQLSGDLTDIADDMKKYNEQLVNIITYIGNISKTIKGIEKIDVRQIRSDGIATANATRYILQFVNSMSNSFKELTDIKSSIDLDDFVKLRKLLMSDEMTMDPQGRINIEDSNGNKTEFFKTKNPGLLDMFAQVAGMGSIMNSMVFVNPIKFRLKFAQTLRLFGVQYNALQKYAQSLNPNTIKQLKDGVDGMQEVLMFLPATVGGMADIFTKYGTIKARIQINSGISVLIGKNHDGMDGVVWATMILAERLNSKNINPNDIETFKKSIKPLDQALDSIMFTLSIAALAGPLIKLGINVLFGHKGNSGVIDLMIGGLEKISEKTKDIKNASKTLLYIAATIGILTISAITLILTGVMIATNWESILVTMAYMSVLVGVFMLVGLATKWIHQGGEELLYIAATVGILSLIAITMVFVGQFLTANWKALWITSIYMIVLVGVFMLVGLATKWIQQGGKELLYIAATVGILALIALVLVGVGQYLEANWEALGAISIMMVGLIGMVLAIGFAGKMINQAQQAMTQLLICIGLLTVMIVVLAYISDNYDLGKLLKIVGIMTLIIGEIGILAIVAGKLDKSIKEGAISLAILTGICFGMSMIMLILSMVAEKSEPLEILSLIGIMTGIVVGLGGLAIAAGALMSGPQGIVFGLGMAALGILTGLGYAMVELVRAIAQAKQEIDKVGFKDADSICDMLGLPLHVFSIKKFGPKEDQSILDLISDLDKKSIKQSYKKIKKLNKIVFAISNIAENLQNIASLNMPIEWDSNGRPISFVKMKPNDFANAAINCSTILALTAGIFGDNSKEYTYQDGDQLKTVWINAISSGILNNIGNKTKIKVKKINKIISYIGNIAATLQNISSLNIPVDWDESGKPIKFNKMGPDEFTSAITNMESILRLCVGIFSDQKESFDINGRKITIKNDILINLDKIDGKTKRTVKRIGKIIGYVGSMTNTIQKLASLSVPDFDAGWDSEKGRWKSYKKMTDDELITASQNAAKIVETLAGCLADETLQKNLKAIGGGKWWESDNSEVIGKIMAPMGDLSKLINIVQKLGNGKYVKTWKYGGKNGPEPLEYGNWDDLLSNQSSISDRIVKIIDIVAGPMAMMNKAQMIYKGSGFKGNLQYTINDSISGAESILKVIEPGNKVIESIVKLYTDHLEKLDEGKYKSKWTTQYEMLQCLTGVYAGQTLDGKSADIKVIDKVGVNITKTSDLIKQINSVNIDKLKTASDMMKHISELSKSIRGNFEGLAKVINEDLLSVLEKLTTAMEGINQKDFNVKVQQEKPSNPGDILNNPSGSAGVKKTKDEQRVQTKPEKVDWEAIKKSIDDISRKLAAITDNSNGAIKTVSVGN